MGSIEFESLLMNFFADRFTSFSETTVTDASTRIYICITYTTTATFLRSGIHKSQSHLCHARANSNRPEGIYYMEFSESSNGLPSYLEYESITRADTRKFSPNEAFNIRCKLEIIDVIAYLYIFTNITLCA